MTLVSSFAPTISKATGPNEKYVKQTYDAMSNANINLESIAIQLTRMPVREQKKFFRLFLNYADIQSTNTVTPMLREVIELSERIMELVNDYYEDQNQLTFAGM